jgi:hypothetical protein
LNGEKVFQISENFIKVENEGKNIEGKKKNFVKKNNLKKKKC